MKSVIIIGGGASGLLCASTLAEAGICTTIIEHTNMCGKKILSTGNGKCNITNTEMSVDKYYCDDSAFIESVLSKVDTDKMLEIFNSFCMKTKSKNGYIYPFSEQATTVREVLIEKCYENKVNILCDCEVLDITDNFKVTIKQGEDISEIKSDYLVVATGGKSYPKFGADGSGYDIARRFKHKIIDTVPALTALICKEKYFKDIAGVRCQGLVSLYIEDKLVCEDQGEIQFTDYGISGIPVFNISRVATKGLKNGKKPIVNIDVLPEMTDNEVFNMISKAIEKYPERKIGNQLSFFFNKKIAMFILKNNGINIDRKNKTIINTDINNIIDTIKRLSVHIVNSKGFDFAQVTAGGVSISEIDYDTLESKTTKNLYFAGEVIDIDGRCGGYNLHFAWASAYIAAMSIINS